jgi:hypothetical protein
MSNPRTENRIDKRIKLGKVKRMLFRLIFPERALRIYDVKSLPV